MLKKLSGFLTTLVLTLLLVLTLAPSPAAAYTSGDWTYLYIYNDNHDIVAIRLNGYSGSDTTLTIPATIEGYPVTIIGTFGKNSTVTDVTIPESVATIDSSAFSSWTALQNVNILGSVGSIGHAAFDGCAALRSINLPSGLSVISDYAFYGCAALQDISIPSGVTFIGNRAFMGCTALSEIDLPDTVSTIGPYAFNRCTRLESVSLPASLTTLEEGTFNSCDALSDISLPAGLLTIGSSCFYGCSQLPAIDIPSGVREISTDAFRACSRLQTVTLHEGLVTIGNYAFYNCINLTGISLPDTVEILGRFAFYGCSQLADVALSQNLDSMGERAFYNCAALKSIALPDTLTAIPAYAFYGCSALKTASLGAGTVSIDTCAFSGCTALQAITIPDTVTSIGAQTFNNCSNLTKAVIGNGLVTIPFSAFGGCQRLSDLTIGSGVKTIESNAFSECKQLTAVSLPQGLTSIKSNAFNNCNMLTEIVLPEGLESIYACAFNGCTVLSQVTIPSSLKYAEANIFAGTAYYSTADNWTGNLLINGSTLIAAKNINMNYAVIPANIRVIAGSCFNNVIKAIYYEGTQAQWEEIAVGPANSNLANMTMYYETDGPVLFETQPADLLLLKGKTAAFTVAVNKENVSYQWQYQTPGSTEWANATATGNKTATLKVPATLSRSGYSYRCAVTDAPGYTFFSGTAILTVKSPVAITSSPASVTAVTGSTVVFDVEATGDIKTWQWQYKTASGTTWTNAGGSAAKTASYSVNASKTYNGYSYRCVITGEAGDSVTSGIAVLTVKTPAVINTQPKSVTAYTNTTARFWINASGDIESYQWQYKTPSGSSWLNATAEGNKTATLMVPVTKGRNGYRYRCVVTDTLSNKVITDVVTLTAKVKLAITSQPVSVSMNAGGYAYFKVSAVGESVKYQWQYRTPSNSTWLNATATGNKTASLKVPATANRNGYSYRCVLTDIDGNTMNSVSVRLTVNTPAPAITTQPANVTAAAGDTAVFQVKTTGTVASYQWQYKTASGSTWANATATGNKTATLKVPVTAARNGNSYRCRITFSTGKVLTSNAAKLTVTK